MTTAGLLDMMRLLVLIVVFIVPTITDARQYPAHPADYRSQLKKLQAGDQLLLSPGIYTQGLPIHHLKGRADAPIVITGPTEGPHAVLIARPGHNTISILDSRYVVIRHLELDGRGLPVDGVKCEGHAAWAHHITLEHLLIQRHNHNQQTVAISTKCPTWNWIIRHNVIKHAGTGLYLGNSDGRAPFIAGLIEHNLVTDTLGYNLQIKHQRERPVIDGMPLQDQVTIIRHNVFARASQNQDRAMARPNVLVGHWPLSGHGQNDRYLIYGNFFYENSQEALFQGEGNIALYNNLFVNHQGNAVRIQPHHDIPREIHIFFNTVLANGAGIDLANPNDPTPFSQWITNNVIFARKLPTDAITIQNNFVQILEAASRYLTQPFSPPGQMNLIPIRQAMDQKKINIGLVKDYPEWYLDFDGQWNDDRFGAYAYARLPNWLPRLEKKPDIPDNNKR